MNMIPAVCNACNYQFPSPFSLVGSKNSVISNCGTSCPKCGGSAAVMDSFTDSKGELHIHGFFQHLQRFSDHKKLEVLQADIEAANEAISAVELSEALTDLDPSFSQFSKVITSIPPSGIKYFINVVMGIITLIIAYQTLQSANENHDESTQLQNKQLELSREEFEYKKDQDKKQESHEKQAIEEKINKLRFDFENKLREIESMHNRSQQTTSSLKGNQRNKPCPCGSGIKSKKCHPNGIVS